MRGLDLSYIATGYVDKATLVMYRVLPGFKKIETKVVYSAISDQVSRLDVGRYSAIDDLLWGFIKGPGTSSGLCSGGILRFDLLVRGSAVVEWWGIPL